MKRIILYFIVFMAFLPLTQAQKAKLDVYVGDYNAYPDDPITSNTLNVLAGQTIYLKLHFYETTGNEGYFSYNGAKLDLLSSDALFISDFNPVVYNINPGGTAGNVTGFVGSGIQPSLDTIARTVTVNEETAKKDIIVIKNIKIKIPGNITSNTNYKIVLEHSLDNNTSKKLDVITFRYQKPVLSIPVPATTACPGLKVNCNISVTPNDLEYYLVKDGSYMTEGGENVKITGNKNMPLSEGVYTVQDASFVTTAPAGGISNPVAVEGDQFFTSFELGLGDNEAKCKGENVSFTLKGTGCYTGKTKRLLYKKNIPGETTAFEVVPGVTVNSSFNYAPPCNGWAKVQVLSDAGGVIKSSNTIAIEKILVLDEHEIRASWRVPYGVTRVKLFSQLNNSFAHDGYREIPELDVYGNGVTGLKFFTNDYTENSDYTYARFHLPYNEKPTEYPNDTSFFNTKAEGVKTGEINKNIIRFDHGKYFEEHEKHCYTHSEGELSVIKNDIFIPEESFCLNDDSTYTIEIQDEVLPKFEANNGFSSKSSYDGFMLSSPTKTINGNLSSNTISFKPNEYGNGNSAIPVEVFARAKVKLYKAAAECPDEWSSNPGGGDVYIYFPGDEVSYMHKEYKCKKNATANHLPTNTSYWTYVKACRFIHGGIGLEGKGSSLPPNPGDGEWYCDYDAWNRYGHPKPIYSKDATVTYNAKTYRANRAAYPSDVPGASSAWSQYGVCNQEGETSTEFTYNYASSLFYVYEPKDDGEFTNLKDQYGIQDADLNMNSNYTVDTIIETYDDTRKSLSYDKEKRTWYFNPKKLVRKFDTVPVLDSANFKLFYIDNNGCKNNSETQIMVGSDLIPSPKIILNDVPTDYCAVPHEQKITGNYPVYEVTGAGTDYKENNYIFNPMEALKVDGIDYNIPFEITIKFRDEVLTEFDTSLKVTIHPQPKTGIFTDHHCIHDTTQFNNQSILDNGIETTKWKWDFGDLDTLGYTGDGSGIIPEGTGNGRTMGTYAYPKHIYKAPGVYIISLKATTEHNCIDEYEDVLVIGDYPKIKFTPLGHTQNQTSKFENKTTAQDYDKVIKYHWDFDDPGSVNDTMTVFTGSNVDHDFKLPGIRKVSLKAKTSRGCISSDTIKFPVFPYIQVDNSNLYHARFDQSSDNWLVSHDYHNKPSGWELEKAVHPYKHEKISGNIWLTSKPERLIANERSWVESPCFDFRNLNFPMLSIDIYQSIEKGRDGAVLEYTSDDGKTWQLLSSGDTETDIGMNWYNQKGIVSNPGSDNSASVGWSENLEQWETARFPLDEIKREAIEKDVNCVRFRVSYAGDAGTAEGEEVKGFGFDNFMVTERTRIVLIEQFVNSVYDKPGMLTESAWLNKFMKTKEKEAVNIRYHNQMAQYWSDPLFDINPCDISARTGEYGAMTWLQTRVDGILQAKTDDGNTEQKTIAHFNQRTLTDKRFDIEVETENKDDKLHIRARVTKMVDTLIFESLASSREPLVRMAIVQDTFMYEGEMYQDILIELLPNGMGNVAGIIPKDEPKGSVFECEGIWNPNVTTIGNTFTLIVYVQNSWGLDEVQQTWFKKLDISEVPQVKRWALKTENINQAVFGIHPVPVKEKMIIHSGYNFDVPVQWKLTDISGQIVKQGQINKGEHRQTVNTSELSPGTYIMIFENKKISFNQTQKVLIVK